MRTLIAFLALSTAAAAQVTVTGKILYEDRPYTNAGFGASVNRPVRQAQIDLLNSAETTVLATGFTNETGNYSLTFAGTHQDVKVRIFAFRESGKINAVVKTMAGATYTVLGPLVNSAASPFGDLVITQAGGAGGAFNIFDCAVKSFQYLAVREPALPDQPPLMDIRWQVNNTDGTYFDGKEIHVLGDAPDTDEYDDDIVFHEIGHWVAFWFSKDDSPGGTHFIDFPADPRLAWSEGWGHYWSAVVRLWVNANLTAEYSAPEIQVDLKSTQLNPPWFDIEAPSFPSTSINATNEVAVAAVMWDLVDPANESFDTLGGLEPDVWQAVRVRIPGLNNITLEDFHAGLMMDRPDLRLAVSGDPSTVRIFNSRQIRYYADPSETNDNPAGAPSLGLGLTLRTFYPALDQDWFTVTANPGTLIVETINLRDGADTVLQLWDSTGTTMLTSNDNRSGSDKSSRINRAVSTTTTFKVHVSAAGINPVIEYGTYDLLVTNPPKSGGGGKKGGGGCGLTGWEAFVLLGLARLARRSRRQTR